MQKTVGDKLKQFFSVGGVFSVYNTVIMGMLVAISVILGQFSIYATSTFKAVSFEYLPGAVVACLFGPWAAIAFGVASDTAKFIARPTGPYFIGFTLSEIVTYFVFACFFYRQKITVWKVIISRIIVIAIVYMGLNYIWLSIIAGTTASKYFTGARLINYLVQFPIHAAITSVMLKFFEKYQYILKKAF